MIFESLRDNPDRQELFTYFENCGYDIFVHSWEPDCVSIVSPMTGNNFGISSATNFVAVSIDSKDQWVSMR